jgi:glutathione synthase
MSLKVAIQMDHFKQINFAYDSTLRLAFEAQKRGHKLYFYEPKDLFLDNGIVKAKLAELTLNNNPESFYGLSKVQVVPLEEMDVVLLRQDPPFDLAYLTTTYLLERIHPKTLVVNNPKEVRNSPEKLFIYDFPELITPSLITTDIDQINEFRNIYKDIVIKPLYGHGGADVFIVKEEDPNLASIVETFKKLYNHPCVVQKYLPEIKQGDKRIILIDGEAVGAMNRVPSETDLRANLVRGGKAVKTELTARDKYICEQIGPELKKRGLIFVGIDVIGDYLTEINVTSPTGIVRVNQFNGIKVEEIFWNIVEEKL